MIDVRVHWICPHVVDQHRRLLVTAADMDATAAGGRTDDDVPCMVPNNPVDLAAGRKRAGKLDVEHLDVLRAV